MLEIRFRVFVIHQRGNRIPQEFRTKLGMAPDDTAANPVFVVRSADRRMVGYLLGHITSQNFTGRGLDKRAEDLADHRVVRLFGRARRQMEAGDNPTAHVKGTQEGILFGVEFAQNVGVPQPVCKALKRPSRFQDEARE
jgi:hypothetical protein